MNDLAYASIAELARAYERGNVTPEAAMTATLERIEQHDARLGAYQVVYADEALQCASASTVLLKAGHRTGPFHGIPFALKDIVDLAGRITTGGSEAMKDRVPTSTAAIARNLIAAGGILIGKTKTVEVAMGGWGTNQRMGTPVNPWDLGTHRAPGGSSCGSGVAVAAGMAHCAVGTDTGGSVRIPASWNGITGLKTTEGTLSTEGILPLSHTLDTPGPMARSVEDALLMLDAMYGRNPAEAQRCWQTRSGWFEGLEAGVDGLRFGAMDGATRAMTDQDVLDRYDQMLETLRGLGAVIEVFRNPLRFDHIRDRVGEIISAEGYYHHGHLMEDPKAPMDDDVRPRIMPGKQMSSRHYIAMLREREQDINTLSEAIQGFDALLTPTTASTAPAVAAIDQSTSPAGFTRMVNYLRMCALSVPAGLTVQGLPAALQIITRAHQEPLACRIGHALEQTLEPIGHPSL